MRIQAHSYELTKVGNWEGAVPYIDVVESLRFYALLHSQNEHEEQFYMPEGKVTLQLRRSGENTYLDVIRTGREPGYVKELREKLGGEWRGSQLQGKVSPVALIETFKKARENEANAERAGKTSLVH